LIEIVEAQDVDDLPDVLGISLETINKYFGHWARWRATGKRVDFQHALEDFPEEMWSVIFLLDMLLGRIDSQHAKRIANEKE
jgi:hypothetical protein